MKYFFLALLLSSTFLMSSCDKPTEQEQWEYKVIEFQREDFYNFADDINKLGLEGWEYAGVLTANGVNGRYVAFKRKK